MEFNTEAAVCQTQVITRANPRPGQNHHGNEPSNAKPVNIEFPQHNIGTKSKMLLFKFCNSENPLEQFDTS